MDTIKMTFWHHLTYLACWMIAMALAFLDLVSARELALAILAVNAVSLKLVALVDKVGFFGFGVVGLVVILLAESYFRSGVQKGQLRERIGLIFGIELLCLSILDGSRFLIPGIVTYPGVWQTVVSFVLGIFCLALFSRCRKLRV